MTFYLQYEEALVPQVLQEKSCTIWEVRFLVELYEKMDTHVCMLNMKLEPAAGSLSLA